MERAIIGWLVFLLTACSTGDHSAKYLRWVGDAEFNPALDAHDFVLCNGEEWVKQYFHSNQGLLYEGEKKALQDQIMQAYVPIKTDQSGWIRIRFIVNCNGETGRFRVISSDQHYQEQVFDKRITDQLLRITKSLDGWMVFSENEKPQDYYQYLIFKIERGNLIELLP